MTSIVAPAALSVPTVCQEAFDLIVTLEVTGKAAYERLYAHPTWPGGQSGVTIGIGFDLGYETADDLDRDWPDLDPAIAGRLAAVCGLTGKDAQAALEAVSDIHILWEEALTSFRKVTLPRYAAMTLKAFPGANALPAASFGSLVSVVYNRGTAMEGQRRAEMRAIHDLIATGNWAEVPAQFRAMKRLWPDARGLRDRREREAVLFEDGLAGRLTGMEA